MGKEGGKVTCVKEEFVGVGWGEVRFVLHGLAWSSVIREKARFVRTSLIG